MSKTLNGTTDTYTYDHADKLQSTSTKTYGYDAAGRTTSVTTSGGTTTLSYDYEDRVTSITLPSSVTDTFSYNGLDTRVGKTDSTGTYSYRRDGIDVTDPVLNDTAAEYTPGVSENGSGTSAFYHADRLGSTTKISDSTSITTDTRQYDAFGMTVSATGTNPTPFGFVGQQGYQSDPDTGLMLLGHRYYDPSIGRFIARDPAKNGPNWYAYCSRNSLRTTNADGFGSLYKLIYTGDWNASDEEYNSALDAAVDTFAGAPPDPSLQFPLAATCGHSGMAVLRLIVSSKTGPAAPLVNIALCYITKPVDDYIDRVNGMGSTYNSRMEKTVGGTVLTFPIKVYVEKNWYKWIPWGADL